MILLGNKILKQELEKSKKIQADHCERIRILEIAIQWCQFLLESRNVDLEPQDLIKFKDQLVIDENRLKNSLKGAMMESHKIAIREH